MQNNKDYGSSIQQAQNLPFADDLNITSKMEKYDYMHVILLGTAYWIVIE
jgi:hypothetical protein